MSEDKESSPSHAKSTPVPKKKVPPPLCGKSDQNEKRGGSAKGEGDKGSKDLPRLPLYIVVALILKK